MAASRTSSPSTASPNSSARADRFRLGWLLIAVATLFSFAAFVLRWSYENSQNRAQLTVDYEDTRGLADAYQIPQAQLLKELQQRGVSSIALYGQTLASYRNSGRLSTLTREEAEQIYPGINWTDIPNEYRILVTATAENVPLLSQILPRLKEQSQPQTPPLDVRAGNYPAFLIPNSPQLIGDVQLGYDQQQVALAKASGLTVTARIANPVSLSPKLITRMLDDAKGTGARVVLFADDEVLGYRSLMKFAADETRKRGLVFGTIEFGKQKGAEDVSKSAEGELVRVHSVGGDEAAKTKPEMLVDRYVRAVRERDIRVAYMRLVRQLKGENEAGKPYKTALQQNLDLVQAVSQELQHPPLGGFLRPGYKMAPTEGFGNYPVSYLTTLVGSHSTAQAIAILLRFFAGLGAVGGVLLLLNLFFDLTPSGERNWLMLGVLLAAGCSVSAGMGAKLTSLVVGCVFSTIGVLWGGLPRFWDSFRDGNYREMSATAVFQRAFGVLVRTTALTFLGGVIIIALMNHWKYMSKADEFLGEKATLLLPIFLIGLAFAGEVFPHRVVEDGSAAARARAGQLFRSVLKEPFTVQVALTLAVLGVAGIIFIMRSGNDSGMEISTFEWNMRALLEKVFLTRPRTKEFLIGMPAVILAAWFANRRQWTGALLAVIAVAIGQADVVNTFCHIHTPIFYSLLRTIHAVWMGGLLGGVALWVWVRIEPTVIARFRAFDRPVVTKTTLSEAEPTINGVGHEAASAKHV